MEHLGMCVGDAAQELGACAFTAMGLMPVLKVCFRLVWLAETKAVFSGCAG